MVMTVEVSTQKELQPENPYIVRYMGVVDNSDYSRAFLFGGSKMEYLCECGCGKEVKWDKWKKKWNRFCKGHSARLPEVREKLREANLGKKHSKETKQKLRDINLGKKYSDETKQKISIASKGRKHSEETKAKMSEIAKNRTKETLQKIAEGLKGRTLSKETKEKISQSKKGQKPWCTGKKLTEEHILKRTLNRIKCRTGEDGYCDQWYDYEYRNDLRGSACEMCGITNMLSLKIFGIQLINHHKDFDKMNCHPNNFKTVCRSCHPKIHAKARRDNEKTIS